ncbi:MAG: hypothetical protein IKZ49_03950 [Alphaproteobacteria bacterium]|nr:hypothetical protein [Alphaproteobacteria bacterium]
MENKLNVVLSNVYDSMIFAMNQYKFKAKIDVSLWNRLFTYSRGFSEAAVGTKNPNLCLAKYWLSLFLEEIPESFKSLVHADLFDKNVKNINQNCLLQNNDIKNLAQTFKQSDGKGFLFTSEIAKRCYECKKAYVK